MSKPEFEPFLERALIINGQPTFDQFISRSTAKGYMNRVNASRIIDYGGNLLRAETIEALTNTALSATIEKHDLKDVVIPLVRTANDFTITEPYYLSLPEDNSRLLLNFVSGIEEGITEEIPTDEDIEASIHRPNPRGLVIFDRPGFGIYGVLPQWPALIPENLMTALNNRANLEAGERKQIAGFANFYFQSCFFDSLYKSSEIYGQNIRRTSRNLGILTYTKPFDETSTN
jgi:hypothetical protein